MLTPDQAPALSGESPACLLRDDQRPAGKIVAAAVLRRRRQPGAKPKRSPPECAQSRGAEREMSEVTRPVPPRKRARILVVDDNRLMREVVAEWITRAPDLKVCGTADSAAIGIGMAARLRPDLVVTDLSMPEQNGLALIKQLHARRSDLPVLVYSMHKDSIYAESARKAGAAGYLMKSEASEKLVGLIRAILASAASRPEASRDGAAPP